MILGLKVIFPLRVPLFTMLWPAAALSRCTTVKTSVSMISPATRSLIGFWGGAIICVSFLYSQFFSLLHTTREQTRGDKNSGMKSPKTDFEIRLLKILLVLVLLVTNW